MSGSLVVDASALVALLIDAGAAGEWVASALRGQLIAAPELVLFETANVLRREQLAGRIERVEATPAHERLLALPVQLWPYPPLATRVWQLRETLTAYDASYVAVAELLAAPVLTLDVRLSGASGPRCSFLTSPPDALS